MKIRHQERTVQVPSNLGVTVDSYADAKAHVLFRHGCPTSIVTVSFQKADFTAPAEKVTDLASLRQLLGPGTATYMRGDFELIDMKRFEK